MSVPALRPAPPPLVAAEVTMGPSDFFPLYFHRLRKSKWWRRASDMARAKNIMLWCEAYQGAPGGSLPDDDDELAEAAGFGLDVRAFQAAKAEIMAPWTLCSDGRWYHPTVCEVVMDRWAKKTGQRKADAERKRLQRAAIRGEVPVSELVPPDTAGTPPDADGVLKKEDRTGDTTNTETDKPSSTAGAPAVPKPKAKSKSKAVAKQTVTDFERWYETYGKKVGRRAAEKAFDGAMARITKVRQTIDDLITMTESWVEAADGGDRQFWPHPSTWLNQDHWNDDPREVERAYGPRTRTDRRTSEADDRLAGLFQAAAAGGKPSRGLDEPDF